MSCPSMHMTKPSFCPGCHDCAMLIRDIEAMILRFFLSAQLTHNSEPPENWIYERDFAFRSRKQLFVALDPYLRVENNAIYSGISTLRSKPLDLFRRPDNLKGRTGEFAATAKANHIYRIRRHQVHGIPYDTLIEPFKTTRSSDYDLTPVVVA